MKKGPEDIFRKHGGQLRMSKASHATCFIRSGIRGPEQVSRGIYRLVELPPISDPDLVTVSLRFPNAVICLISALAYHDITTQIPHAVSVAVPRNSRVPSLYYPPIQAHRFSNKAYNSGTEVHLIDGVSVQIYSPEKTLANCSNTMLWSGFFTSSLNPLTLNDLFLKAL